MIRRRWPVAILAIVTYVPLLLTHRGKVGADTKTYLYLDPSRLLARAWSMWDPNVGLGTVTHQNIGYLFPMGPYYWLADAVGVPDWVAQRLWLGSILFAAGAGVWFLLRDLGWPAPSAAVAMFVYALTPYTLTLAARISVILLPFAALPWLIALTARAIRRGGWRDPALFALVVLTVGGVNATALVFVGVAPFLWAASAVAARRHSIGRVIGALARIGVLTVATSLWWMAGLGVQGGYGIDILRYTETAETVASASVAPEVLRGLGYWFFYGGDRLGPWIEPGSDYTQRLWLLGVTYALPILGLLGAAFVKFRHRTFFVSLFAAGVFIAVGAHPWDDPSLAGRGWHALLLSERGLALRSTPRAAPLVALALAVFVGAGVAAASRRIPTARVPLAVAVVILAMLGMPPLFTGRMLAENLERPERIPRYWDEAAEHLDDGDHATRVLEVPGADFASYRWGNTVDPITPGLIDRPFAARELIPYGSPPSADLLIALDRQFQENLVEPRAIAPLARLLGVGDLVVRNDLQYERFRLARPYAVTAAVRAAPGIGDGVAFGPPSVNRAVREASMDDELALASPLATVPLPPVEVHPVESPRPIVSTASPGDEVLVAGDGEGVVALASAGLLDGRELIRYTASLGRGDLAAVRRTTPVVVTDTNRRRARRWNGIRENAGYTERAGERPLERDLSDNRLPVFGADEGDESRSVTVGTTGVHVQATSYGNPTTYTPEHRPSHVADGDLSTVWRTGHGRDVRGERVRLTFDEPVTTDRIRLVQLAPDQSNRSIATVELVFDGDDSTTTPVTLDATSATPDGQTVTFPPRTFRSVDVRITGDTSGRVSRPLRPARFTGLGSVGFAEIDVAGRRVDELVRVPRDAPTSLGRDVAFVFTRMRTDPAERVRDDEEPTIARRFGIDSARSFGVYGEARISARAAGDVVDRLLRGSTPFTVTSSRRLPGDIAAGASAAIDGDPRTAWVSAFGEGDDWIEITSKGAPFPVDRLTLSPVVDDRHSVPTAVRVDVDGAIGDPIAVPPSGEVRLPAPLKGERFRIAVTAVAPKTTTEWFSGAPIRYPVAIRELGIPGVVVPPVDAGARFTTGCRDDLVTIAGEPLPVEVSGTNAAALARQPLAITPCAAVPSLAAGDHDLRTTAGTLTGIDIDRLVLRSDAEGAAVDASRPLALGGARSADLVLGSSTRTSIDADVTPAGADPFWVVLGQSANAGWKLRVSGGRAGDRTLVNGYANGWLVTPAGHGTVGLHLEWTPQRTVDIALVLSAVAAALCIAIVAASWARRRRHAGISEVAAAADVAGFTVSPARAASGGLGVRLAIAVVGGGVTAVVVGPVAGAVVLAVGMAAARSRTAMFVLRFLAAGALGIAAAFVILRQARYHPPPAFEWPQELDAMHQVAWLAVALVVLVVLLDAAPGKWVRTRPNAQPEEPEFR